MSAHSIYFDGTDDYLNVTGTNAGLAFGTENFTIEMYVYFMRTAQVNLYDARPAATQGLYPLLYKNTDQKIAFFFNSANQILGTTVLNLYKWYHIALVRKGQQSGSVGSTQLYIDGVLDGEILIDVNNYINGTDRPRIAASNAGDRDHQGYISNLRVVAGAPAAAIYTAAFTKPSQRLENITNTQLLIANEEATSTVIKDNSSNNYSLTVTGTPRIVDKSPFMPDNYFGEAVIGSEEFNSQLNNNTRIRWQSQKAFSYS
jgi:hypothetical protein